MQGVLRATSEEDDITGVSENMVRWAEKLGRETIVLVEGHVREAEQEVKSAEVHAFEMDVMKVRYNFMCRKLGADRHLD